jgi:hypothetical protein
MIDKETARLLDEIAELRAFNRGMYATLEYLYNGSDKTMDLLRSAYAVDPEKAKILHRHILENDLKVLEVTKKLCG